MSSSTVSQEMLDDKDLADAVRSDDADAVLRHLSAGGSAWQLLEAEGNKSLLQAAWLHSSYDVASCLLKHPTDELGRSCLSYEVEHDNVDLLRKVFAEDSPVSEAAAESGFLDEAVRYAARNKDSKFLQDKLPGICGDSWPQRISATDAETGRHSLHCAALGAGVDSIQFLVDEFDKASLPKFDADAQGDTFVDLLLRDRPLFLQQNIEDFRHLLPLQFVDSPLRQSAAKISDAEAKAAMSELLPGSLLLRLPDAESKELLDVVADCGSCRLLRGLLALGHVTVEEVEKELSAINQIAKGKMSLAKLLLLLRRRDVVEEALLVRAECERLLKLDEPPAPIAAISDMRQFAESVCLNAIDVVYADCLPQQQQIVHRHLLHGVLEDASVLRTVFSTSCFADLVERRLRMGKVYAASYSSLCGGCRLSPLTKFRIHFTALIVYFVLLMTYITLLPASWHVADFVAALFIGSLIVQELHDFTAASRSCKKYYCAVWNLADVLPLIFLVIGLVLKVIVNFIFDETLFHSCRGVLAFGFMVYGFKFLSLMRAFEKFGPFINMLKTLFLQDLVPFLSTVYLCLVVCSGLFFQVLLNPGGNYYSPVDGSVTKSKTSAYWDWYLRPLLLTFGEYQIDDLQNCIHGEGDACPEPTGNKFYTRGLLHVFLLIVNLLLMNLLIAKFSLTVATKDEQSHHIWRRYRYSILQEFQPANIVPPPFNIMVIVLKWLMRSTGVCDSSLCCCCCGEDDLPGTSNDEEMHKVETEFHILQALALRNNRDKLAVNRCDEGSGFEKLHVHIDNCTATCNNG